MGIEIETLHHVSLSVTDLEQARAFYGGVLGLRKIERPPFDFPGAWFALGDRQLHLIVHTDPRSLRGTTEVDPRDGHFAMRVKSYGDALARLRANGVVEAGCLRYQMLVNTEDPTEFTFTEEWTDAASLDAHFQTEHIRGALECFPELLAEELDLRRYALVG